MSSSCGGHFAVLNDLVFIYSPQLLSTILAGSTSFDAANKDEEQKLVTRG